MGKPKKRTTPRRTGNRRSHLVVELARKVLNNMINGKLKLIQSWKAKNIVVFAIKREKIEYLCRYVCQLGEIKRYGI